MIGTIPLARKKEVAGTELLFEKWINDADSSFIWGLHFHIGCESSSYAATIASLEWLTRIAAPLLPRLEYVNIGGDWLRPNGMECLDEFHIAIKNLRSYGIKSIFTEPGTGLIRDAGLLVTRVIDVIDSGTRMIAVVDSHVGHAPEIFEYRWAPNVYVPDNEVVTEGGHEYEIAGCTPLAGDIFGRYRFHRPLEIGQALFFHLLGSYAYARANLFTGVLWPSLYRITQFGELCAAKEPDFFRYRDLWRTKCHHSNTRALMFPSLHKVLRGR